MSTGSRRQREEMADQAAMRTAKLDLLRKRVKKYTSDGLNITETARVLGISGTLVKSLRAKERV